MEQLQHCKPCNDRLQPRRIPHFVRNSLPRLAHAQPACIQLEHRLHTCQHSDSSVGTSEGRQRKSKSLELARLPELSTADRRALLQQQDTAVQRAVSRGVLQPESYTDGMLYAIGEEAENDFWRTRRLPSESRQSGNVDSATSRKRKRSGLDGQQGQVASAVKSRKVDSGSRKRVVGADEEEVDTGSVRKEPVLVEVDLCKLLGI